MLLKSTKIWALKELVVLKNSTIIQLKKELLTPCSRRNLSNWTKIFLISTFSRKVFWKSGIFLNTTKKKDWRSMLKKLNIWKTFQKNLAENLPIAKFSVSAK